MNMKILKAIVTTVIAALPVSVVGAEQALYLKCTAVTGENLKGSAYPHDYRYRITFSSEEISHWQKDEWKSFCGSEKTSYANFSGECSVTDRAISAERKMFREAQILKPSKRLHSVESLRISRFSGDFTYTNYFTDGATTMIDTGTCREDPTPPDQGPQKF